MRCRPGLSRGRTGCLTVKFRGRFDGIEKEDGSLPCKVPRARCKNSGVHWKALGRGAPRAHSELWVPAGRMIFVNASSLAGARIGSTQQLRKIAMSIRTPSRHSGTSGPRHRLAGLIAIALVSGGLALATASECQSITHLPSLMYGIVLWGWWGCVAAGLLLLGSRRPSALQFTPRAAVLQVLLGCILSLIHLLLLGAVEFTSPGWRAHLSGFAVWTSLLNVNRFGMEMLIYGFIFG